MLIYREHSAIWPAGSICTLYGKKDGFLIAPYKLILANEDTEVIRSANDAGLIKMGVDEVIGKIFSLPISSIDNLIKPIVPIGPEKPNSIGFDPNEISMFEDISRNESPVFSIGSSIVLEVVLSDRRGNRKYIIGEVIEPAILERPLTGQLGGASTRGYVIEFNNLTNVPKKYIGARVRLEDIHGPLLGMLYDIEGNRGFVFPCEKI